MPARRRPRLWPQPIVFLVGASLFLSFALLAAPPGCPARANEPATTLAPAAVSSGPTPSPDTGKDERIARLWKEAERLEAGGDLEASARVFEQIAALAPADARPCWRAATNTWNLAAALPAERAEERERLLDLTEQWGKRGLEADPECGECYLYAAAVLGARLRAKGWLAGAAGVSSVAEQLERGIELLEKRPDRDTNPELEELYYASAQLYRSIPEWPWLQPLLGVHGDRRRAVEDMRKACQIAGRRPSYQVELGAALLCLGVDAGDSATIAEGLEVLERVGNMDLEHPDEAVDREHARRLIAAPKKACDYSRDDWLDAVGFTPSP